MREPDPSNLQNTMTYLDEQASLGRFEGKSSALHLLTYLARHSWRKYPNPENAPIGAVMSGKSKIKKMAEETSMSTRSTQRALDWLTKNSWVERTPVYENNRRSYDKILTLLDPRSHRIRENMYELRGDKMTPTGVTK